MPYLPRLKVCCISSLQEARLAIEQGAHALGLVSAMPSGPGVISEEQIARIARATPPGVTSVLLTSLQDAEAIIAQQRRLRTRALQLVDRLPPGAHRRIRAALPGIAIIQVVHVTGQEAIAQALALAPDVDALLLDSGRPDGEVKELGGTGRTHNWEISREICAAVPVPVFLAGGLTPQNVGQAIQQVRPFGVDVCSGVRTEGRLDAGKLAAFARAVRSAGEAPCPHDRGA